jgi:phytoene dehydrogenase-like protein
LGLLAHRFGWPIPEGGSQQIINAMAAYLESMGGKIETNMEVKNVDDLPESKVVLFDVTPRQLLKIAGHKFTPRYNHALERYRYGPGVFKMDWALSDPIPWKAEECHHAGTVHLGGPLESIMEAEQSAWDGKITEKPFVLCTQQSLFDKTRAPEGKHTGWAYCHVPSGSTVDMTEAIESQIERFAPGFKDCIIKRTSMHSEQIERYNPNYVGGDINGGVQDLRQLFTRPMLRRVPYTTPAKNIFICSSSTPPGGGVHGMCGYYAAKAALQELS